MAAPFVSGVIAHLLSLEGDRTGDQIWKRLKNLALKNKIDGLKKTRTPNRLLQNSILARRYRSWKG